MEPVVPIETMQVDMGISKFEFVTIVMKQRMLDITTQKKSESSQFSQHILTSRSKS